MKRMICTWFLAGFLMLFISGQQTVYADDAPQDQYKVGKIDRILTNRVIIDDVEYKLTSQTKFLSKSGKNIGKGSFENGTMIIFYADKKRNLVVLKKP